MLRVYRAKAGSPFSFAFSLPLLNLLCWSSASFSCRVIICLALKSVALQKSIYYIVTVLEIYGIGLWNSYLKINKNYLDRWLDEGRTPDWCVEESPSTPLIPSINKHVHYSRGFFDYKFKLMFESKIWFL